LFVGIWILARTLIPEGIIQSPKAGSFITTVLIIVWAGLIGFSIFYFFSDSWRESFTPIPSKKRLVLVNATLRA